MRARAGANALDFLFFRSLWKWLVGRLGKIFGRSSVFAAVPRLHIFRRYALGVGVHVRTYLHVHARAEIFKSVFNYFIQKVVRPKPDQPDRLLRL